MLSYKRFSRGCGGNREVEDRRPEGRSGIGSKLVREGELSFWSSVNCFKMVLTLVLTSFAVCWPYTPSVQTNKQVNVTFPRPSKFIGGMRRLRWRTTRAKRRETETRRFPCVPLVLQTNALNAEAIQTSQQLSRACL